MQRLRDETRAQHIATEAIPFSSSILAGTLPRGSYAAQLMAYLPIHRSLEAALNAAAHPAIDQVWTDEMRRTHLLEADLDDLGIPPGYAIARSEGEALAAWIDELAASDPVAVLGVLYVLEGSTLGGAVLRKHLSAAYGLTDAGLAYYAPYGKHPKPHWVAFSSRMNEAVTDPAEGDRVVAAARETFTRIGRILVALTEPAGVPLAV